MILLMGQFMKPASSLFSAGVFSPATLYAEDFEQTLAETPRYIPCALSAVICGMDWWADRLGQSSCVIQETVHQAAEADGACPSVHGNE